MGITLAVNLKHMDAQQNQKRNNSTLSYADCCIKLLNPYEAFEDMSNDDLDSLYAVAFQRWAYHLTIDGYIQSLYKYRAIKLQNAL